MTTLKNLEVYRKMLLKVACTKKKALAIYCGTDPEMKKLAREANQVSKMPLEDRRRVMRFLLIKPLKLEDWL